MLRMNKGMNIYIDSDNRKKMNKYKVKIMNDIDFLLFSWKDTSAQAYNLWSSLSQISYHIAVRFSCIQGKCLFLETNSRLRGHRVLQSDVGRVDCVFSNVELPTLQWSEVNFLDFLLLLVRIRKKMYNTYDMSVYQVK